jgi:hypothetical protein
MRERDENWRKPHEDETVFQAFGGLFAAMFRLVGGLLMLALVAGLGLAVLRIALWGFALL